MENDDDDEQPTRTRRRRRGRGNHEEADEQQTSERESRRRHEDDDEEEGTVTRSPSPPPWRVEGRGIGRDDVPVAPRKQQYIDEITDVEGSTRLEAKKQRRRDNRCERSRQNQPMEQDFLARREHVERLMVVRERERHTQISVIEDNVLVEHYVSDIQEVATVGNIYLGRVQNVLPSMEAAFVDIGQARNGVLYAGEVNWDSRTSGRPAASYRTGVQVGRSGAGAGNQGSDRPQGRKAYLAGHLGRPFPRAGAVRRHDRREPQAERA